MGNRKPSEVWRLLQVRLLGLTLWKHHSFRGFCFLGQVVGSIRLRAQGPDICGSDVVDLVMDGFYFPLQDITGIGIYLKFVFVGVIDNLAFVFPASVIKLQLEFVDIAIAGTRNTL